MKDNWIELLFNLFEKSLTQIKEDYSANSKEEHPIDESDLKEEPLYVQANGKEAVRVLSHFEQIKLTKPSYQFLMRMKLLGVFSNDTFENIMNTLQFSESRIVTLEETKWAIRKILANKLDAQQLAFLDLVLYDKELAIPLH